MGVCLVGEYVEDREKWDALRLSAAEISIVSFPLTLKIVLATFWYTPIRVIEVYASVLVRP